MPSYSRARPAARCRGFRRACWSIMSVLSRLLLFGLVLRPLSWAPPCCAMLFLARVAFRCTSAAWPARFIFVMARRFILFCWPHTVAVARFGTQPCRDRPLGGVLPIPSALFGPSVLSVLRAPCLCRRALLLCSVLFASSRRALLVCPFCGLLFTGFLPCWSQSYFFLRGSLPPFCVPLAVLTLSWLYAPFVRVWRCRRFRASAGGSLRLCYLGRPGASLFAFCCAFLPTLYYFLSTFTDPFSFSCLLGLFSLLPLGVRRSAVGRDWSCRIVFRFSYFFCFALSPSSRLIGRRLVSVYRHLGVPVTALHPLALLHPGWAFAFFISPLRCDRGAGLSRVHSGTLVLVPNLLSLVLGADWLQGGPLVAWVSCCPLPWPQHSATPHVGRFSAVFSFPSACSCALPGPSLFSLGSTHAPRAPCSAALFARRYPSRSGLPSPGLLLCGPTARVRCELLPGPPFSFVRPLPARRPGAPRFCRAGFLRRHCGLPVGVPP